jgi:hypothetical protein
MTSKAPAIIAVQDLNSISPAEAVAKAKEDTLKQARRARARPGHSRKSEDGRGSGVLAGLERGDKRIGKLNSKILFQPGGVTNAIAVRFPKRDEHGVVRPNTSPAFTASRCLSTAA